MNIIDVGSCKYAYYSTWLSKYLILKIYVFEPHPENYQKLLTLRDTLSDHAKSRLFIWNKAVVADVSSDGGDRGKKVRPFYLNNDANSSSLLQLHERNVFKWKYPIGRRYFKTLRTIDVDCVTLSDVFINNNIKSCELLIVDTQGDALDVLNSLTYTQHNAIKRVYVKAQICDFDLYKGQSNVDDINRLLRRRYFQLYRCDNYSKGQEQYMYYLNSVMKNRGVTLLDLDGLKM